MHKLQYKSDDCGGIRDLRIGRLRSLRLEFESNLELNTVLVETLNHAQSTAYNVPGRSEGCDFYSTYSVCALQ